MKNKRVSTARRIAEQRFGDGVPGTPRDYIGWLLNLPKTTPIVMYCRVSVRQQDARGNLQRRKRHLSEAIETLGFCAVRKRPIGNSVHGWDHDRPWLRDACAIAKKSGAVVVTHSWDRFLRSREFHSAKNPDVVPTNAEFQRLLAIADGVSLVTLWHPDTDSTTLKYLEQAAGIEVSTKKVGRPSSTGKRYDEDFQKRIADTAIAMRKQGKKWREIGDTLCMPFRTVHRWVNKHCVTPPTDD